LDVGLFLSEEEFDDFFDSNECYKEVGKSIYASRELGIDSVPFTIINNKYAVSGAQDSEVFFTVGSLSVLEED
jgi:predicted DsbA family dithiol-disulfide isomerase